MLRPRGARRGIPGELGDLRDGVEVPGVDLARIGDHDRRQVALERGGERVEVHAPCPVACQPAHVGAAQPEHPDRLDR